MKAYGVHYINKKIVHLWDGLLPKNFTKIIKGKKVWKHKAR